MYKKLVNIITITVMAFGMLFAASPAFASNGSDDSGGEVKGILAAVDAAAGTVTITPMLGGADIVLTTDASTYIERNDIVVTLAGLIVGETVEAKYDEATLLASKIETEFKKNEVKGIITAIDTTAGTVTVQKNGVDLVLIIDATTYIKRNSRMATLAELQLGDKVEIKYDSLTMIASKIEAKLNATELKGLVVAVDAVAGTVTVQSNGVDTVLTVDATTYIKRNSRIATLAELQLGDKVEAKYNSLTMIASKIEAKLNYAEAKGFVAAVDAVAGTVTIRTSSADVVLTVDAATYIKRDRTIVTLAGLLLGDKVEAKYNAVTMIASKIEAKLGSAEVKGVISAVDTVAGTVTITTKTGTSIVLTVDAATYIKRDRAIVTLADLVVGDKVEAKYNAITLIVSKIEAKH